MLMQPILVQVYLTLYSYLLLRRHLDTHKELHPWLDQDDYSCHKKCRGYCQQSKKGRHEETGSQLVTELVLDGVDCLERVLAAAKIADVCDIVRNAADHVRDIVA